MIKIVLGKIAVEVFVLKETFFDTSASGTAKERCEAALYALAITYFCGYEWPLDK